MRAPWRTSCRFIGAVMASLIILFAIALNLARAVTPLLDSHHQAFEHWVSAFIHRPVTIGRITATWYGFEPAVKLDNLQVLTESRQQSAKIKHFTVALDLFSSLWHRQWLPGRLMVDGLDLDLAHQQNLNLPNHSLMQTGVKGMVEWLLTQAEVRVKHVNITWHGPNGFILPMHDIRLEVENGEFNHHIVGTVQLAQAISSSFHFIVDLHSDQFFSDHMSANVFLNAHQVSLVQWMKLPLMAHYIHGLHINSGTADIQLWGQWRQGGLFEAQTMIDGQHIALSAPNLRKQLFVKQVSANTLWQKKGDGWQLSADKIKLNVNHRQWLDNQLLLKFKPKTKDQAEQWQLALSYLRLSDVQFILSKLQRLPDTWRQWVGHLQPQGQLHQLTLAMSKLAPGSESGMTKAESGVADYRLDELSAVFHELRWHGYQTIPAVTDLNGQVSWLPSGGHLIIDSPHLTVATQQWFHRAQEHFKQFQLGLTWQKQVKGWALSLQQLQADDGDLALQLQPSRMFVPNDGVPTIDVTGSFRIRDLTATADYVPLGVMSISVTNWLQRAFLSGEIRHGQWHIQGPINKFPFDQHEGDFSVDMEPVDLSLRYAPGWPTIDQAAGELHFHDREMKLALGFAKTAGATLRNIKASIPDLAKGNLVVNGDYAGTMAEGHEFLQNTPLGIGQQLKPLQMSGLINGGLQLKVALTEPQAPVKLLGHLNIKQGIMSLPGWNTDLTKINGRFDYTERSCSAKNVSAHMLQRPVKLSVHTLHRNSEAETVQVTVGGSLDLTVLNAHYHLPKIPYIQGATDYRAILNLHPFHAKQSDSLSIVSDLRGIAIGMPVPLGKSADAPRHFYTRIDLNDKKPLQVRAKYGRLLSARLNYQLKNDKYQFTRGAVRIGKRHASVPKAKGLTVSVNLPYANGRDWMEFYRQWEQHTVAKSFHLTPRLVDIRLTKIILWNMLWSGLHLRAQPMQDGWFAQVNSQHVDGQINIPNQLNKGIVRAEFHKFNYVPLSTDGIAALTPKQIPAIDFTANELRYKNRLLGHAHAVLKPMQAGVKLTMLKVKSNNVDADVRGEWTTTKGQQRVISAGSLKVQNWGYLLRQWQLTDVLAGGQGMIGFQLKWPGRVTNFKMAKTSGQINVALKDGRILQISKKTQAELGLGRFLNILSLQSLPRRLVLNFGDIGKKGFGFDEAKGSFKIVNGVATTNNVILDGDLAKVDMQGKVGLAKKIYDLHMQIKPNVTGSLPFIATVTGGPLAGAITWLVNKLFVGPTVGRAAMVKYNITGNWNHPIIKKVG